MSAEHGPVAIIGVGLIGGSIAAALKKRFPRVRVVGIGRSQSRLELARQAGLVDVVQTDVQSGCEGAELVVVCTPVSRIVADVRSAAENLGDSALITDAGSVKKQICEQIESDWKFPSRFVGSHPLAGGEKTGFEHSSADLYEGRVCVVTPSDRTADGDVARIRGFWESLGARVLELSPAEHDQALALTSHLPHLAASALAGILPPENADFAASGFRDSTRIAAGDPDLWTAIFLQNQACLLACIEHFCDQLAAFRRALEDRDAASLKMLLETAKTKRDALDS